MKYLKASKTNFKERKWVICQFRFWLNLWGRFKKLAFKLRYSVLKSWDVMRVTKHPSSCTYSWFRLSWSSKFNTPTRSDLSKTCKVDLVLNSWWWTQWGVWLRQWKLREVINPKRNERGRIKSKISSNEDWLCLTTITIRYDCWRRKAAGVNISSIKMIWNNNW